MSGKYRSGAIGALLDEYERAISDLKNVIRKIPDAFLVTIIDRDTSDENCRTIQAILSHVVHAGYGYATSIYNNHTKGKATRPDKAYRPTVQAYLQDLDNMLAFTEKIFAGIKDTELEQNDNSLKILTSWGQQYDIEQLMEHAIVHILRHRRQIKRFLKQEQ